MSLVCWVFCFLKLHYPLHHLIETVFSLPASKLSSFVFKLLKQVGTLFNLLMSSLSTSAFTGIKSPSPAKSDVPTPVA